MSRAAWLLRGANDRDTNRIPEWIRTGYASIGWEDCEYVRPGMDLSELAQAISRARPDFAKANATRGAGYMDGFLNEMSEGDFVITNDGDAIHVGTIAGGPEKLGSAEGGAMWQRKITWLTAGEPLQRGDLPRVLQESLRLRPTLVDVTQHAGLLAELTETGQDDNWAEFVHWALRLYDHEGFDEAERVYKLAAAEELRGARQAFRAQDEWIPQLRRALAGENNLVDWRAKDTFVAWCLEQPAVAERAVAALWGDDEVSEAAIDAFSATVSAAVTPGNKVVIASALLMGVDAHRYPPFRPTPDWEARRLLGISARAKALVIEDGATYEPEGLASDLGVSARTVRNFLRTHFPRRPEESNARWVLDAEVARAVVGRFEPSRQGTSAGSRYSAFLELLGELSERMGERGVELRDLLDAQSLVWWVTGQPPPEEWDEDERAAFLAFQGREPESDGTETVNGSGLLPPVTDEQAKRLYLPREWLQDAVDLLTEKRQVIFYGPPGTGKTFVAQALGEHVVAAGGDWQLIQFHPAYSYEDFFEGYRPAQAHDGNGLQFDLRHGPLRRLADEAAQNPERPYLLVIDEINRGNIAKIFGELYFLLEYRNRPIRLQYSPEEEFSLPPNLFVLGTMNTADRSIALVDSALRRRFYFLPFLPRDAPVRDVLGRWLAERGHADEPARLLDALNAALREALPDDEFAIGPSYFMPEVGPPNLDRVWRYAIQPLLEDRFYGSRRPEEIEREFGLDALRARLREAGAIDELDEGDHPA